MRGILSNPCCRWQPHCPVGTMGEFVRSRSLSHASINVSLMASIMLESWLACQMYAVLRVEGMAKWLRRLVPNVTAGAWRRFAAAIVFSMFVIAWLASSAGAAETSEAIVLPKTGDAPAGMESYDRLIAELMAKWKIPGGQIGVVKDGSLVLSRDYGWADVEAQTPVAPSTRFRIASVSKPLTAVTVLRLAEQQRLSLDARAFETLKEFSTAEGADSDPRLREITVRQLLTHTAGWDRDRSFDPMFMPLKIAKSLGAPAPAEPETIIRYMLRQPLDFAPGQKYAYSNFGYCLLGRLIEQATGKTYEQAVRELVLDPCGAGGLELGHTLVSQRAGNESQYYSQPAEERTRCVLVEGEEVCWPDGGFYLEAMDAHGGWIGSATDLLKFATALDGSRGQRLLQPESLELMTARPAPPVSQDSEAYYGFGWSVRRKKAETGWQQGNWWHTGSLPGTSALLVRTGRGMCWAALFNSRPPDDKIKAFAGELDALMWRAAGEVNEWPKHDLFAERR